VCSSIYDTTRYARAARGTRATETQRHRDIGTLGNRKFTKPYEESWLEMYFSFNGSLGLWVSVASTSESPCQSTTPSRNH
jgi:hypothetical protein